MRMIMTVTMETQVTNESCISGSMGETIKSILDEQQPEAAYFVARDGRRTGIIVLDIAEPSDIPAAAEPWFLAFEADVELEPAMTIEDLGKAEPAIEQVVKTYG